MNEGLIPNRYAKALLKFALEKGSDERLYGLMNKLQQSFAEFSELEATMENPFVDPDKKLELLTTASGADSVRDDVFADFMKLLKQNNRLPVVRSIAIAYADAYRRLNKIYKVDVTAAAPMSAESEARLKEMILRHLDGGSMEYDFKVDPSLIGGFSVKVGSERLDASIKNELKQIEHRLLG